MWSRLYGSNHANFDAVFKNFSRHYAKKFVHAARRKRKIINPEPEVKRSGIPIITCKRSSFNFYKGDRYDKWNPVLASQSWNNKSSRGDYFYIHPYDINNNDTEEQTGIGKFEDLNLDSQLCERLEDLGFECPLEIQNLTIPKILKGCNAVVAAETGCGKTLAYMLPLITKVLRWKEMEKRDMNCPLGLIVTPSRELAVQLGLELIRLSKCLGINTKLITGGRTKKMMRDPPVGNVDILVCSFGVISKLSTIGIYNVKSVKFVVLDEADALLHETFEEKLQVFLKRIPIGYHQTSSVDTLPTSAQLILASATIPSRLETVLGKIVNVNSLENITTDKLHKILVLQKFMRLGPSQKAVELLKYIKPKVLKNQPVIVFSNQADTSYWVCKFLHQCGVEATNLSGEMSLYERRGKYGEFINGTTKVLSTTNAGSRGLDTVMVNHILNYEFPLDTSDYIHRCGRTGRIGTVGECRVTNFISKPGEIVVVQKIEKAVRKMKPFPIFNLVNKQEQEVEEEDYTDEPIENLDSVDHIPY
ncbi:putative ATP-dependent RNA helicase Dbp21E2 [Megachile rotundata]|uniref:putative ATP-dependent RNA helicase Dbp21E2 n=1 Tax=Megachile rotundata TaxID=143995 RepID=UPI000615186D|nr:PREDICTED: probable ATP-dependent RNA helicase DDX28 [Megachile rotundata]